MTRRGIFAGVLLLLCLFCGLATGYRDFFAAAAILFLLLLTALLTAALLVPRVLLSSEIETVTRGESVPVALTLKNPFFLPVLRVRGDVILLRNGDQVEGLGHFSADIRAHSEFSWNGTALCAHRGEYAVAALAIRSEDLFGMFSLAVPAPPEKTLLSLPRLIPLAAGGRRRAAPSEDEGAQGKPGASGELLPETRAYRPGDSLSRIHWKQFASRGVLAARQREASVEPVCAVVLDTSGMKESRITPFGPIPSLRAAPDVPDTAAAHAGKGDIAAPDAGAILEYEDQLCECALTALFAALAGGRSAGLVPDSDASGAMEIALTRVEDLAGAREELALLPFSGEGAGGDALARLCSRADLPDMALYISAAPDDTALGLLARLQARGCAAAVLSPAAYAAERCGDVPWFALPPGPDEMAALEAFL